MFVFDIRPLRGHAAVHDPTEHHPNEMPPEGTPIVKPVLRRLMALSLLDRDVALHNVSLWIYRHLAHQKRHSPPTLTRI